jgi:hypothetical protein
VSGRQNADHISGLKLAVVRDLLAIALGHRLDSALAAPAPLRPNATASYERA